jgi:hypothetical protein
VWIVHFIHEQRYHISRKQLCPISEHNTKKSSSSNSKSPRLLPYNSSSINNLESANSKTNHFPNLFIGEIQFLLMSKTDCRNGFLVDFPFWPNDITYRIIDRSNPWLDFVEFTQLVDSRKSIVLYRGLVNNISRDIPYPNLSMLQ